MQQREDVTARLIPAPLVVRAPLGSCTVAGVAAMIGRLAEIPTGVEHLPGPCTPGASESTATEIAYLQGMTVVDALDRLVKLDPRYYWTATDGVIIVRPLAAWTDRTHFLHRTLDRLTLDKANLGEALDAAVAPLRPPRRSPNNLMQGVGELTIDVGPISIIEALDAVVRTHGRARWEINYCRPEAVFLYARIFVYTLDDQHGIGVGGPWPRDNQGKTINPCATQ